MKNIISIMILLFATSCAENVNINSIDISKDQKNSNVNS